MPLNLTSLLWFAVIVAAIPVTLWLLRRTPLAGGLARPGTPRVTASTIVTMSAASRTSRKTSSNAANMDVFPVSGHSAISAPCAVSMWNSPKNG